MTNAATTPPMMPPTLTIKINNNLLQLYSILLPEESAYWQVLSVLLEAVREVSNSKNIYIITV